MNNNDNIDKQEDCDGSPVRTTEAERVSSRRRLFRQGASVVAVTLISRPVLAWHCKSPSAWGSELINPNTSLKTNEGHQAYVNETWTIANWRNNQSRAGLGKPWDVLKARYGNLFSNGEYNKVKVKKLYETITAIKRPSGLGDRTKIVDVLANSNSFQAYIIVAQLNHLLLAASGWDNCLTLDEINEMATGSYSPGNSQDVVWLSDDIKKYLYENWIVRP
jgi:hypothetical protein